jgi:hypothetical protein
MCRHCSNGWGSDMNFTIDFTPLLPMWLIVGLAAIGLALIGASLLARTRGSWLRALALVLLVASLTNPTLRHEEREALKDVGIVIVDRSQSQNAGKRSQQIDAAEAALRSLSARLENTDLRFVTVQSGINPQEEGTRLFSALDKAMSDVPADRFAGAIMVTDGQVHDVPEALAKYAPGGPVHAMLTGSRKEIDRRVTIDQAPRFGIVGKEQTLRFHVDETGSAGVPVNVTMRIGTDPPQTVTAVPGQSVEVPMALSHAGANIVELTVPPLANEITLENNRAIAVVEGIRDRLRVLLVSGEPHPGERTWRNLLKADSAVDLVHFTILRPPEKQDGTPINELSLIAFPTRELFVEKIRDFDLVIFDRYHREAILPEEYIQQIADYVKEGGALLVASGPELAAPDGLYSTALASVLSAQPTGQVLEGGFKPQITRLGARHPVTAELEGGNGGKPLWGRWFRTVDTTAPEAETVMAGNDGKPLLVLSRQGEGRTAQLLSDQSWLWARGFEGGGPQTELLRRLAHWLMKEPGLEEEALTGKQSGRELLVERRTMADKADPVTVTGPSGKATTLPLTEAAPGLWRGSMKADEAGVFGLKDGKLEAVAAATSADARELRDILATPDVLKPAADQTGGGISWLEDGQPRILKVNSGRQMAGTGWLGLKSNGAYRVMAVSAYPLFASLAALAAALLLISLAWLREGR